MLGLVEVGASEQDTPVCLMGERGPDLLIVDDPIVAVAFGARADGAEIGAPRRLRVELAPDLFATQRRWREAVPLRLRSPAAERRHADAELQADGVDGGIVIGLLLVIDHLLDGRAALAVPFGRP